MSNPLKLNAANAAAVAAMPSLEQQSIDACLEEIRDALKKYACELVYQEITHNGARVNGTFVCIKRPS